jgi:2,3-bisphosphoglycerate-dependent phosphoglycerate mutase
MHLYFIRHAQSQNNLLYEQTGSWTGRNEDPELSETGQHQAQALAQFLACREDDFDPNQRDDANRSGFGITHVYASLMTRAISTGVPVAAALGQPLIAWEELHETGGIFLNDPETGDPIGQPGKTRADFEARFPTLVLPERLNRDGWWRRPFEASDQWPLRARRFLLDLAERHSRTTDRVAVISHGGFYNQVIAALLNMPPREDLWFDMNNAAVTRIDFHDQGVDFVYTNRTDYLPRELIT